MKKESKVMTDDIIIQEAIRLVEEGMSVTFPVKGNSMLPFIIGGRESVVLQKCSQPKVGDVVLARVEGCRYVVHRIICVDSEQVVLMGDGNSAGVEHCGISDVKALATHVVGADGRQHDLYTKERMLAARIWGWLCPIRRYILGVYRRVAKFDH